MWCLPTAYVLNANNFATTCARASTARMLSGDAFVFAAAEAFAHPEANRTVTQLCHSASIATRRSRPRMLALRYPARLALEALDAIVPDDPEFFAVDEEQDQFSITVELPGMRMEDCSVRVDGRTLHVVGESKVRTEGPFRIRTSVHRSMILPERCGTEIV